MKWTDLILEFLEELVMDHLLKSFPSGIPSEVAAAVMPEVRRLVDGEPVHLFELRRLVTSITNQKLREIGATE